MVADPELRFTQGGKAVVDLRLVTNDRKKVDGKWEDGDPFWVRATVWERMAENVAESVRQGDRVIAIGRMYSDEYEDREGNKRSQVRMTANAVALSLLFNAATVQRTERRAASDTATAGAVSDPWDSGAAAAPAAQDDDPPF